MQWKAAEYAEYVLHLLQVDQPVSTENAEALCAK